MDKKWKQVVIVGCMCIALVSMGMPAHADEAAISTRIETLEKMFKAMEASSKDQISALEAKVAQLQSENKALKSDLGRQAIQVETIANHPAQALPAGLADDGIVIGLGVTQVMQGVLNNPNGTQGKKTDSSYSIDIAFEKKFEDYGKAFASLEAGEGSGLPGGNVSSVYTVNQDAANSSGRLDLSTWGYQQYFNIGDAPSAVTFGKLDATCSTSVPTCFFDGNAYAGNETTQFLNGAFKNAATANLPSKALGVVVESQCTDLLGVSAGMFDGNADWEEINESLYSIGQVTLTPELGGRNGAYRIYGFHAANAHTELKDSGRLKQDNFGFGLSADQQLTDNVGAFARIGWADGGLNTIEFTWSTGCQFEGDMWKRDNDVVGIALGQAVRSAQNEKNSASGNTALLDDNETIFELYYNFFVNDHLTISPDLQFIVNPNGAGNESTDGSSSSPIVLGGMRTQVTW